MICYRLSDKGNRFSLMATGKYMLSYSIGTIVTAPKGTLGIFCFRKKEDVEYFQESDGFRSEDTEIYKVRGIGKMKIPTRICHWLDERELNDFYEFGRNAFNGTPYGIVLFNQVEVLE